MITMESGGCVLCGRALCALSLPPGNGQMDAMYITDAAKLLSGCLTALTAMVHLEVPHINVITKCDLVDKKEISKYGNRATGVSCMG